MYVRNTGGQIRVPFPDLGELRQEVSRLLSEDRILIDYGHLQEREHRVTDWEIQTALLDGVYDYHEDLEDRHVARYVHKTEGVIVTVMFEVQESTQGRYVFVATAFRPRGKPRKGER